MVFDCCDTFVVIVDAIVVVLDDIYGGEGRVTTFSFSFSPGIKLSWDVVLLVRYNGTIIGGRLSNVFSLWSFGDGDDDGTNSLFTDGNVVLVVTVFGVVEFDGNNLIGGWDSVLSSIGLIVLIEADFDSTEYSHILVTNGLK